MGELIRRLDYQRRTKKSLMVDTSSGQRISKEHSPQVRAANEMADRQKDLYIESMEKHKKLFLDRFSYDKKIMVRFKADLDAKSVDFNEFKFQQLRSKSAKGRLQSNEESNIGPVTEIVPRHYYRGESTTAVSFDIGHADKAKPNDVDEKDSDNDQSDEDTFNETVKQEEHKNYIKTLNSWANITKKPPSGVLRRRRMSLANFDGPRFIPARDVRRKSAPPKVMNAFQPRDVKSAHVASRRNSRSSLGSATSNENLQEIDQETAGRSFRLLREAFKKKTIEQPNRKQDKLNIIREDHRARSANLHERTLQKFDKLFSDQVFLSY